MLCISILTHKVKKSHLSVTVALVIAYFYFCKIEPTALIDRNYKNAFFCEEPSVNEEQIVFITEYIMQGILL